MAGSATTTRTAIKMTPEYTIVRTNRKTLAIYIRRTGEVEVRAPRRASTQAIEAAVRARADWIAEKVLPIRERFQAHTDFTVTEGSRLRLLGREYPVEYGEKCGFDGERFVILRGDFCEIKPQIIRLYRTLAEEYIFGRVREISEKTGLSYSSVRISLAKARWGSCSGKNALSFSWRLILAPPSAVDYVIVHELAHTKEHNHSDRFWRLVEGILPDYRLREELLKELHDRLLEENWDKQ